MRNWIRAVGGSIAPILPLALIAGFYVAGGGCSPKPDAGVAMIDAANPSTDDQVDGWPVSADDPQGHILIYQPQPESLVGNQLKARAAVSLTPPTGPAKYGVAWFTARVATDRDTRTATLDNFKVSLVRLLGVTSADQQAAANAVSGQLSQMSVDYSLDQLMTSLDTAEKGRSVEHELGTAPPKILFSSKPATLVIVAGPPQLKAVAGVAGVVRVINTPFVLLQDASDHRFYLKEGTRWASAAGLDGPWEQKSAVPAGVVAAGKQLTARPSTTQPGGDATPPAAADLAAQAAETQIIVSTVPAELIVTTGAPQFTPLPGGQLLYASNSASNVFLDSAGKQYYVLLSGRWYTAAGLQGPWTYTAPDKLPPAFAEIPADSPKSNVLTFVPHTPQAADALLEAAVPQTAAIRLDAGTTFTVAYDGTPQFDPIPQCPGLTYATNTPDAVLQYGAVFYCCHQAVWYQSPAAVGPWTVSTSVPEVIYTIPPQNPLYNNTFVHIYDAHADYVDEGYTPGYTGTYTLGPTVVFGTGYDYPAWSGEVYLPQPLTWGFNADYDLDTGYWGYNDGFYGGFDGWFATSWGNGGVVGPSPRRSLGRTPLVGDKAAT